MQFPWQPAERLIRNPPVNGMVLTSTPEGQRYWAGPVSGGGGNGGGDGAVASVFGRTGAVVAQPNDYLFAQIGATPTTLAGYGITDAEGALGNPSSDGQVLSSTAAGVRSWITPSAAAPVSSVFGRTGAIVALAGDYSVFYPSLTGSYVDPAWITSLAWSKITGHPTTLSGYGITDPVVLTSGSYANPAWITSLAWSKITGTPSSLAGYGILDPVVLTTGSYANPAWITSLAWSKITGAPAAPVTSVFTRTGAIVAQAGDYAAFYEPVLGNPAANGYILSSTIGGVRSWIAPPSAPVTSVFTRTGAITAQSGDYAAFYQPIGSYEVPLTFTMSVHRATNTISLVGDVASPTGGTGVAQYYGFDSSGTRGFFNFPAGTVPPVTSVFSRTGDIVAAAADYSLYYPQLSATYNNPPWITGLAWSKITGTPTTLAGYGITDPVVLTTGSYADPAWITSLAWSKITGTPAFESPLTFQQSLFRSANTINLAGDVANPGNSMLYGTNASGTKGWYSQAALGGGTVTSVSSGSLTGLFTTSVSNATTTPAINYAFVSQAANTFFGNNTAAVANPAFSAMAALTAVNDTNVTLTLGGTPATALFKAVSLTLGWSGLLGLARGGLGVNAASVAANTVFGNMTAAAAAPSFSTISVQNLVENVTGTGNIVLSASPTFTGTAVFANINPTTILRPTVIQGVNDGSSATAGVIGETISSYITWASRITSGAVNVAKNVTQINLSAGDWDVRGVVGFYITVPASGAAQLQAQIGSTSNSLPDDGAECHSVVANPTAGAQALTHACPLPPRRISLSATTLYYLVGQTSVAGQFFGYIEARRVR